MSQLRVIVCRVDDKDNDKMTEIAAFNIPEMDISELKPDTALDELEATTQQVGQKILRGLFQARWNEVDKELAEAYRQSFPPWTGCG